jgi:hypothetical protein
MTLQPIILNIPPNLSALAPIAGHDLVRLGGNNDGGYVIAKESIDSSNFLIAMGISADWSFEESFLAHRPGLQIQAYDHTISKRIFRRSIRHGVRRWLIGKESSGEILRRIGILTSYGKFFSKHAQHYCERVHNRIDSINDVTIQRIFQRTDSSHIFLKIDIEGSEYRIIDDLMGFANRIEGLAIEFHETDPYRSIFLESIKKLQNYFDIVHLHANNDGPIASDNLPETLEISFARKRTIGGDLEYRQNSLLQDLDQPNNPNKPQYQLIFNC